MSQLIEVKVPDIGDYAAVPVIEVHVQPGDTVQLEQSLLTLESDKATMDVPSPAAGIVREVKLKVGDNAAEGVTILTLEPIDASANANSNDKAPNNASGNNLADASQENSTSSAKQAAHKESKQANTTSARASAAAPTPLAANSNNTDNHAREESNNLATAPVAKPSSSTSLSNSDAPQQVGHASPSVRKFARELGVDITKVSGSGPKGRITQADVQNFVKAAMSANGAPTSSHAQNTGGELNLLPWPKIDFTKFGAIEAKPLSRIKKLSAANLARNWVMIPAVTYHEEADITELEAFRTTLNKENEKLGVKLTMLAFLIKASAVALKKFPEFNASLDGDQLILKHYFHIGFAADTPNGLLVPVIRDVDRKGVLEIAAETAELAQLARAGKLKPEQMQGACFTISSVGGIGGTGFAPIINAPEVAILGVSRSTHQPVWDGKQFVPRLIMPLSMTADHRVIDGAMATRFNAFIAQLLSDFRRVML